jgi:hypothetical protein
MIEKLKSNRTLIVVLLTMAATYALTGYWQITLVVPAVATLTKFTSEKSLYGTLVFASFLLFYPFMLDVVRSVVTQFSDTQLWQLMVRVILIGTLIGIGTANIRWNEPEPM